MGKISRKRKVLTHYNILGVSQDASSKEIKKAWRRLAEKYHPDKTRDKAEHIRKRLEKRMKLVNLAKDILMNPTTRSFYDYRLGYRDCVEVIEEEIEEVEPIRSENEMINVHSPSPVGEVQDIDEHPRTDDVKGDVMDEAEVFAEAIEYFEIDESDLFSATAENSQISTPGDHVTIDSSKPVTPVHGDSESTVDNTVEKGEKDDHINIPDEFGHKINEEKIPFWDMEKPEEKNHLREFKKIEGKLLKDNLRNVKSKRIFDKGKAYHMEVRPVSFYRDENVTIEVTSSGLKYGDIRQKRKRKE